MVSPKAISIKLDEEIEDNWDGLYQHMNVQLNNISGFTDKDELDSVGLFPKPYVFAKLTEDVYKDSADLDKLPQGWDSLISRKCQNGYIGRAYWPPDLQQVVIAHRGTEFGSIWKFFKDLLSDLNGILLENTMEPQVSSAVSFVNQISEVLAKREATLA